MPLFEVTVKGRGIRLAVADGEAVGFFRLVRVSDNHRPGAEAQAMKRVATDWRQGTRATINRGDMPTLTIDQTVRLPWWRRFVPHRSGYVFFAKDEEPPVPRS